MSETTPFTPPPPATASSIVIDKNQPSIDTLLDRRFKIRSRSDIFKPNFKSTTISTNLKPNLPKAASYADAIRFNPNAIAGTGPSGYVSDAGSETSVTSMSSASSGGSTASRQSTISVQSLISVTSVTTQTTMTYMHMTGNGSVTSAASTTTRETSQCWRRFIDSD